LVEKTKSHPTRLIWTTRIFGTPDPESMYVDKTGESAIAPIFYSIADHAMPDEPDEPNGPFVAKLCS
jgi:hypothetical protein